MRYLVLLALLTTTAHADDAPLPATGKMVDKVVEMTNQFFDQHVDLLTHDMLYVRVDAEHRAAKIAVGGGDAHLMKLRFAGNVEVVDGTARIHSRLALGLGGKQLDLRLPNIDVSAASYRGERGVEVRLPLLRRSF
ncbi:MAG TPA: hypothetical protein VFV99_15575 [Kofleriaceae bacterium]|nr:hypothetical protein [Kofleriaceae bacterium]